jgi:ParB-like chromosome segregation protein Spo0J
VKHHQFANLFPMQTDEEIQTLADDIRSNGLRQPVIIDDEDNILDGRNRAAACVIAGVEPVYEPFIGTDGEKLAFVVSVNLHRRHLTISQRAMVAEKMATMQQGDARTQKSDDAGIQASQTDAAAALNVSRDSVQKARKIRKTASPETISQVERGELSLNAAIETVKPSSGSTVNGPAEKKSPSVSQIQRTLMRMSKDKKRHGQLIQIAREALLRMTSDDRIEFLAQEVSGIAPEHQAAFMEKLNATKAARLQ